MRPAPWSRLVAFGAAAKKLLLPELKFGSGTKASWIFKEIGFSRDCGIVLFGNGWPVDGSLIVLKPAKFPCRWAGVGTTVVTTPPEPAAFNCRMLSHPPQKNSLSRLIGPPTLAPN